MVFLEPKWLLFSNFFSRWKSYLEIFFFWRMFFLKGQLLICRQLSLDRYVGIGQFLKTKIMKPIFYENETKRFLYLLVSFSHWKQFFVGKMYLFKKEKIVEGRKLKSLCLYSRSVERSLSFEGRWPCFGMLSVIKL